VASFCLDEDMAAQIADGLTARGHDAIAAKREAVLRGQSDPWVLWEATRQGRITVTHNERHFKLLHDAWLRWPLTQGHAGILVVPQRYSLSVEATVEQLDGFGSSGIDARNRLFLLQQQPPGSQSYGWLEWVPRRG
jgi:hypothetical protein